MAPPATLSTPVSELPKIRSKETQALGRLGVATVRDLLLHLPIRWDSYGSPVLVGELQPGAQATVVGVLESFSSRRAQKKRDLYISEASLVDESGSRLRLVWFHRRFVPLKLRRGDRIAVAGEVRLKGYGGVLEMASPRHEMLDGEGPPRRVGGLSPRYPLSAGITSPKIEDLVETLLPLADGLEDTLPADTRLRNGLPSIGEAVRWGHQPKTDDHWRRARRRMAFAELLELQLTFLLNRRELQSEPATPIPYRQEVIDAFKDGLAFELTRAQRRSTWDIFKDLQLPVPMNRLLNGDVGSGKTAVAAAAVAMAHAAGLQSVVMAPTEILARQHLEKFRAYLEDSFPDLRVDLLVSGLPAAERKRVLTAAASGHTALLVGTHALIEDRVDIVALGLAVVDEQHRFGTRQRELLRAKGSGRPHFLAMTATPIPRTLALARHGDMTVSVLDEVPPGRTPVETRLVGPEQRDQAYQLVRREVAAGRQAFVICPLVEESDKLEAKAATVEFERLRTEVFPDLRLALVHGKMKDKDVVMRTFAAGESDILVATAVVEVGVDVANATVMLIEGAERFGLAQLHQFRGRVGRGSHLSHCILLADELSEASAVRLKLVETERDGFRLAEADLRARGAGELLGTRQHGLTDLAMAELLNPTLLNEAREEAELILEGDPGLESNAHLREAVDRRLEQVAVS